MAKYKKRKDGRYAAWVTTDEINPETGKRVRIQVYGRSVAELERKKAEVIEQTSKGIYVSEKNVTFGAYKWKWLTPDQVAILPISEKFNDYAQEVKDYLKRYDVRAIVDERNEKIGRKIRDNEMKRIPYMLIVGEKEAENREVSVRKQGEGDQGTMKFEEFAKKVNEEVQNMINKW